MEELLIFGHKNPDTDSVTSAITLANLKNKLNIKASPKILGDINNETKFVLNYFEIPKPSFLNDVKLQIKDVNFLKTSFTKKHDSILSVLKFMKENHLTTVPVVEKNDKLAGIINLNDILQFLINCDFQNIKTSLANILQVLEGAKVLGFDENIAGNLLVAAYETETFIKEVKLNSESILILGDRPDIQEYAVENKIKLLILSNNFDVSPKILKKAKEKKVNIIKSPLDSYKIANLILFSNFAHELMSKEDFVTFKTNDYVSEFKRIANDSRQVYFPALDKDACVKGLITLDHLNDINPKKVILVDHNEADQSVIGIEEAQILEVIDHHKIGNMSTAYPINFRNMIVGSCSTIIFHLYQENNVKIDPTTAGLLMAGIISDTLLLRSPTTTALDKKVLCELNKISKIDYQKLAEKMFAAASSIADMSKEEIIYSDFKTFTIHNQLIGLGQFKTTNQNDIKKDLKLFKEKIEEEAENKNYTVFALFITDIINNGSYIIYNKKSERILEKAFELEKIEDWIFISDKISRKQQMIPRIIDAIEKAH